MDEALRDLVVIGLIALVCFVGAVEYVYWRFGVDKIQERLEGIYKHEGINGMALDGIAKAMGLRRVG